MMIPHEGHSKSMQDSENSDGLYQHVRILMNPAKRQKVFRSGT
jgi:hypothetical protein